MKTWSDHCGDTVSGYTRELRVASQFKQKMLPYNIASYGLLLSLLCKETNTVPGELIGNLGDTHIYKDQLEFVDKQLQNDTYKLPHLKIEGGVTGIFNYKPENFKLIDYKHAGKVHYPLSN